MRCLAFAMVLASAALGAGPAAGQSAPAASRTPSFSPSPPTSPGAANAASRAMLITQIQSLLQAFGSTPMSDPARPALALQIVDTYAVLEDVALRDKINAQNRQQQLLASGNPRAAAQQKLLEDQARGVVFAAHRKAIEYCSLILTDHPAWPRNDGVRFRLAREYEATNDGKNARSVYDDLIKKHSSSPYVPQAYLALGELFFEEATTDATKLDLAAKAYAEVTKYPPPANTVYGYAWYKVAFVHWNKGDISKARQAFKQAIDFGAAYPQVPGATALANAASKDSAALPP